MIKRDIFTTLLYILVSLTCCNVFGQLSISKDNIPNNISSEIKEKILALYSNDGAERGNAVMQLRDFRANALKPVVPFLFDMLSDDSPLFIPSAYVSWAGTPTSPGEESAKTLAILGDDVLPKLLDNLKNENKHIRKCSVVALGIIQNDKAVDPLISLYNSEPTNSVIVSVVEALGNFSNSKVIEPLITSLNDKDWDVREKAANAFTKRKVFKAVEPLLKMLEEAKVADKSSAIRDAEKALGSITNIQTNYEGRQAWIDWLNEKKQ